MRTTMNPSRTAVVVLCEHQPVAVLGITEQICGESADGITSKTEFDA